LQDLPPYVLASGNPCAPYGINSEGLKRRGFSSSAIMAIKRAYKSLYKSGLSLEDAKTAIQTQVSEHEELKLLADFLAASERGIVR
jgi:UDP-N-acetylglucosamine acyltransferase